MLQRQGMAVQAWTCQHVVHAPRTAFLCVVLDAGERKCALAHLGSHARVCQELPVANGHQNGQACCAVLPTVDPQLAVWLVLPAAWC